VIHVSKKDTRTIEAKNRILWGSWMGWFGRWDATYRHPLRSHAIEDMLNIWTGLIILIT